MHQISKKQIEKKEASKASSPRRLEHLIFYKQCYKIKKNKNQKRNREAIWSKKLAPLNPWTLKVALRLSGVLLVHLFHSSFLFTLLTLFLSLGLFTCTIDRGLTFTSARVLVSSTCRLARLATHRRTRPHLVCIPCSYAHFGRVTTACVSWPRRLGCLHWLAPAARHGHFWSASTSGRSVPVSEPRFEKLAKISVET